MKKLTIIAIALLISACSMLAPDFDNSEYGQFVEIHTHATYLADECGTDLATSRIDTMKFESTNLLTYATHISNNEEITAMAKIIDDDLAEMRTRADNGMSAGYCKLKVKQLKIKLDTALKSVGAL
jgi:hypothetical protein